MTAHQKQVGRLGRGALLRPGSGKPITWSKHDEVAGRSLGVLDVAVSVAPFAGAFLSDNHEVLQEKKRREDGQQDWTGGDKTDPEESERPADTYMGLREKRWCPFTMG